MCTLKCDLSRARWKEGWGAGAERGAKGREGVVTFCCGGSAVRAVRAWVLLILRRVPWRVGRRRARVKTPLQLQGMFLCDLVYVGRGSEGE